MDKLQQTGGGGVTPDRLNMRVLLGVEYNLAKPLQFGKSGYNLAKGVLLGKR